MSAVLQGNFGNPRATPAPRPALRAVPRLRAQMSVRSASVLVVSLIALVVARLFVQVGVDASAYAIAELNKENVSLSRDAEFLTEQLNVLNSPQNVAAMASTIGMVSNSRPAYLRLSDGTVWGDGAPAVGVAIGSSSIANRLMDDVSAGTAGTGVAATVAPQTVTESGSQTISSGASLGIPAPATH